MGELQAAHQRGLIAYFPGTKLVTRMKRSKHSSHESAASLGTEDGTASRRNKAEQDEAVLTEIEEIGEDTGSVETGGLARTQAGATDPALGATTAVPQASNLLSLIPLPVNHLSAVEAVRKGATTRSNSVRGRFTK